MKQFITILSAILILAGCKKAEDTGAANNASVQNILTAKADWKVSYLQRSSMDKTGEFIDRKFTFSNDGRVVAVNDLFTVNGTWSVKQENNKSKLNLSFEPVANTEWLNGNWLIVEIKGEKLDLDALDPENAGDKLNFIR